MSFTDDASLIIMVPLKTGGGTGWFSVCHPGTKNPEWNRFRNLFPVGEKGVTLKCNVHDFNLIRG